MKKIAPLLMLVFAFAAMNAETYLDSAYYGFEDGTQWQFQHADSFEISETYVAVGAHSLRCHTSVSLGGNVKIQSKKALETSQFQFEAAIYRMTLKVYKPSASGLISVNTNLAASDPAFQVVSWDISSIETDKWVTLTQDLALPAQVLSTSKINIQLNKNQGPGEVFIDDLTITDITPPTTIADNVLDVMYYGFEGGITGNNAPYFTASDNHSVTGNEKSLKFVADPTDAFGNKSQAINQGADFSFVVDDTYEMSLKVWIESNAPSSFNTSMKKVGNAGDANYSPFVNIVWDMAGIATGQWVTIKKLLYFNSPITLNQLSVKVLEARIADGVESVIYIDDIALIPVDTYTATISVEDESGNAVDGAQVSLTSQIDSIKDVDNGVDGYANGVSTTPTTVIVNTTLGSASFTEMYPVDYATEVSMSGFITSNSMVSITNANVDSVVVLSTDAPTSVEAPEVIFANIYPNPASEIVNIQAQKGSRINIYSITGAMVRSISNVSALTTITTNEMTKGIYLVSVENNNGTVVEKLQVK